MANFNPSSDNSLTLPFVQITRMLDSLRSDDLPHERSTMDWEGASALMPRIGNQQTLSISDGQSPQAPAHVVATYRKTVLPVLRAMLPRSLVESTTDITVAQLSRHQTMLLIYAVTNNLAGIDPQISSALIYDYLKKPMIDLLGLDQFELCPKALPHKIPSSKSMAETFFRCAVEAGDVQAVGALLCSAHLAIDVNKQSLLVQGRKRTAIERSAELQHLAMTKLLVEAGADVNKTYCSNPRILDDLQRVIVPSDWPFERQFTCPSAGALECAIVGHYGSGEAGYELATMLSQAMGAIGIRTLSLVLYHGDIAMMRILLSSGLKHNFRSWSANRFLHEAMSQLGVDALNTVIEDLRIMGFDFTEVSYDYKPQHRGPWSEPRTPPTLVDIMAERGKTRLIRLLRQYGAVLTIDTLVAAVRSQQDDTVQYLLHQGIDAGDFSRHYHTTPLAEAILSRNTELIKVFSRVVRLDRIGNDKSMTALLVAAAETGNIPLIKCMLPLHVRCSRRETRYAMAKAVRANETEAAILLLEANVPDAIWSINGSPEIVENNDGHVYKNWPLPAALRNRNAILVRKLLDHDIRTDNGSLPSAIEWGDKAIIEDVLFASVGVDPGVYLVYSGICCPWEAAINAGNKDCLSLLQKAGIPIPRRSMALNKAVQNDDIDMVRALWACCGAEFLHPDVVSESVSKSDDIFLFVLLEVLRMFPNGIGYRGTNALCVAIEQERWDRAQHLIEAGASCTRISNRLSPLGIAIRGTGVQNFDAVQTMLRAGARVDDVAELTFGTYGRASETALVVAISTKRIELVKLILDSGANVDMPANRGIKRTPLQRAAEIGSYAIVQLLLDKGANANGPPAEHSGRTAFQLAAAEGYIGIAELLLSRGAHPGAPAAVVNGRTAIEGAAEHGRLDMVDFLLKLGPQRSAEVHEAMRLARENDHSAVVERLEESLVPCCPESRDFDQLYLLLGDNVGSAAIEIGDEQMGEFLLRTQPDQMVEVQPESSEQPVDSMSDVDQPASVNDQLQQTELHACNVCPKKLSNASALRRHERSMHTAQFPALDWQCDGCSRSFRRKDTMERHRATHDGSNSVECPSCARTIRRKDYLAQHVAICKSVVGNEESSMRPEMMHSTE